MTANSDDHVPMERGEGACCQRAGSPGMGFQSSLPVSGRWVIIPIQLDFWALYPMLQSTKTAHVVMP